MQVILTNIQIQNFDLYINDLKGMGFNSKGIVSQNGSRFLALEKDKTRLYYCKDCLSSIPASDLDKHQCLVISIFEL